MKMLYKSFFLVVITFLVSCTTDADDESDYFDAAKVCPASGRGTFTDERDGQVYRYTTIGKQVWMAQNLNYHVDYDDLCMYKDDDCVQKGRLYYIRNVFDACPNGWHLPSDKEWMDLFDKMGGVKIAGMRLKANKEWLEANPGEPGYGTDDCAFSAKPALYPLVKYDGFAAIFLGSKTYKSTGNIFLWKARFSSEVDSVFTVSDNEGRSFSVRCVKD